MKKNRYIQYIDIVQEFINKGYRDKDISYLLGFDNTRQFTNVKRRYLGRLKRQKIMSNCEMCGKKLVKHQIKFCSRSCSASKGNLGRVPSQEQRQKVSEALYKGVKRKKYIYQKKNKCKGCNKDFGEKRKLYCNNCRYQYYNIYRPSCEFKFDPLDYCEWFNCSLIENHGKYSPSNKGNNLDGVSRDHMYTVKDGFVNGVAPEIIKHPANCKLMLHVDNNRKNTKSSITLSELHLRILRFDKYINEKNSPSL